MRPAFACQRSGSDESWPHFARIAGDDLEGNNPDAIASDAGRSSVYGIETDAFVVGCASSIGERYCSCVHREFQLIYLPFLEERGVLQGTKDGSYLEFMLPPVERGAAVRIQK